MTGEQRGQDMRIDSSDVGFPFSHKLKCSIVRAGFQFVAEELMAIAGPGRMKTDDSRARLRVWLVVDPGGVPQLGEGVKTAVAADDDVRKVDGLAVASFVCQHGAYERFHFFSPNHIREAANEGEVKVSSQILIA